tara:strand:- start:2 stop:178 length:177 start_codon:yes stop_codon:yes gene_type:complete
LFFDFSQIINKFPMNLSITPQDFNPIIRRARVRARAEAKRARAKRAKAKERVRVRVKI